MFSKHAMLLNMQWGAVNTVSYALMLANCARFICVVAVLLLFGHWSLHIYYIMQQEVLVPDIGVLEEQHTTIAMFFLKIQAVLNKFGTSV